MIGGARSTSATDCRCRIDESSRSNSGYTLAEALVALVVAAILIACLAIVLAGVGRLALRHTEIAAAAEAERAIAAILGAELRALTAADATFGTDSVRLRAFRGVGRVCWFESPFVHVDYEGVRSPEPDKDSVLIVWPTHEAAFDLDEATAPSTCGESGFRLKLGGGAGGTDPPIVALVFETGAYSLRGAALRYRRGASGRQPLTDEVLATSGNTLRRDALGRRAVITVRMRGPRVPASEWPLAMPQGATRPHTSE